MIKFSLLLMILGTFFGCSFKTPANEWQYKSSNAFSSYVKHFMYGEDRVARNDLKRAVKYAKMSANLKPLARVYLGKCALNISVGVVDRCSEYESISNLIEDEELSNYYSIITKSPNTNPKDILDTDKVTSILLNGALEKDNLTSAERAKLLEIASYNGYKKAVIFWLKESLKYADEETQKESFQKKLKILK